MATPDTWIAVATHQRALAWRWAVLAALVLLLAWTLLALPPIAQPPAYHAFADTRALLGLPHAADVLSNTAFIAAGLWGLARLLRLRRAGSTPPAPAAWWLLCIALVTVGGGSALYHLAPANAPLVFDRIPITWACVAVLAAFLAERCGPRVAAPALLAGAVIAGTATVLWWWWTESQGRGDLRPYLFVQLLPMLVVPAALLLRLPRRPDGSTPDTAWWAIFGAYAAAKAAELADRALFDLHGGALSGHTLKHLLAAAGAALLLRGALGAAERSTEGAGRR